MEKEMFNALKKLQDELKPVKKDATNPYFNADYATLAAIWESIQPILSKNGFIVNQPVRGHEIITILVHESGGVLESNFPIISKTENNPQDFGSAITYARRYALSSLLGIVTEDDDDANSGSPKTVEKEKIDKLLSEAKTMLTKGMDKKVKEVALKAASKKILGKEYTSIYSMPLAELEKFVKDLKSEADLAG